MRSRRCTPMVLTTGEEFLTALRASRLLSVSQLSQLTAEPREPGDDALSWSRRLTDRGLLTPYQAEQLLGGCGEGLVLGQYRILDRLGAGGMGQVFKAEHQVMRRVVALKVIAGRSLTPDDEAIPQRHTPWPRVGVTPGPPSDSPGLAAAAVVERFYREVQLAAQLHHPNIVTAFDAAEANGLLFLVMEHVEGTDLGRYVAERGPLPVARACEYVRQAALGLQHAHERGLVHRDVKPSNLLVTRSGVVKLLDLGLACAVGGAPLPATGESGSVSGSGSGLAGTPDYMAPELAHDSRTGDARSDLYSLGCTFYYLLTGQVPFPGGGWTEKLLRHQLDSAPAACVVRPDVPEEISAIVHRLMAKDPGERHPRAGDLAEELRQWLQAHQADPELSPAEWPGGTGRTPMPSDSYLWTNTSAIPTPVPSTAETPVPAPRPALPQPPPAAPPGGVPTRPLRVPWPVALGSAMTLGLLIAWLAHGPLPRRQADGAPAPDTTRAPDQPGETPGEGEAPARPSLPFVVVGLSKAFPSLAAAVAAAPDEGSILVRGPGPLTVGPLDLRGKALTIRAADGTRPHLRLMRPAGAPPWQPLLGANRPLVLEGLELSYEPSAPSTGQPAPAHLIHCDGGSLTLKNCRLHAPAGSATVVCRDCRSVQFRDCRLTVGALAVCLETGDGGDTALEITRTEMTVASAGGAALSVWSREGQRPVDVRLDLEGNTIQAGRILAVRGVLGRAALTAHGNAFTFRQALLSFAGLPGGDAWRAMLCWEGQDNAYRGGPHWLTVEGTPVVEGSLDAWQAVWGAAEVRARAAGQ